MGGGARGAGVALGALGAPTAGDDRRAGIGEEAGGFVYLVAVTGVTGGEMTMDDRLRALVARARRHIPVEGEAQERLWSRAIDESLIRCRLKVPGAAPACRQA